MFMFLVYVAVSGFGLACLVMVMIGAGFLFYTLFLTARDTIGDIFDVFADCCEYINHLLKRERKNERIPLIEEKVESI